MINQAVLFATKAHEGQLRKGSNLPYIFHPMEVGMIVSRMTDDPEVIEAAVLHDVVEDCKDVTVEEIRARFGDRVARIVSRDSSIKTGSWRARKLATLKSLKEETMQEARIVALADKLSNVRSLYTDSIRLGDGLWQRFNMKDKRMQGWYYRGLIDALSDFSGSWAYKEFRELVDVVFGDEKSTT